MRIRDLTTEAEKNTPAAREISKVLTQAGYKKLGSGADATVWAKDEGSVFKILMPDDATSAAAETFKSFYNFCQQHKDIACLPRFMAIGADGQHHKTFNIGDREFTLVSMERLYPIRKNTFAEGMVWFLSDYAMTNNPWDQVKEELSDPVIWVSSEHFSRYSNQFASKVKSMSPAEEEQYETLYTVMQILYKTGQINKIGWDLHTENVMQRKDGTLVIVDPWFDSEQAR